MAFKFEKLRVWQMSLDLSYEIHLMTMSFPNEEKLILEAQLKRATDSICLNIAEGSTGQTNAQQKKFIGYATRSAIEVIACLHLGKKRSIISQIDFEKLYCQTEQLVISLQAFKKSL